MRKFVCPFCDYVKMFYGREARRSKKKVVGFTCPGCGRKVSAEDVKRKKGKGPKPSGNRRKREKKQDEPVVKTPDMPPKLQLDREPIKWKTQSTTYRPPWEKRHLGKAGGRGDYTGWQLNRPLQPTDQSLGEAAMGSLNINPSAPIPRSNPHSNPGGSEGSGYSKEDRESLEEIIKALEEKGRKLGGMILTMSNIEGRVDAKTRELDSKLQVMSALLSRMEDILTHYKQRAAERR